MAKKKKKKESVIDPSPKLRSGHAVYLFSIWPELCESVKRVIGKGYRFYLMYFSYFNNLKVEKINSGLKEDFFKGKNQIKSEKIHSFHVLKMFFLLGIPLRLFHGWKDYLKPHLKRYLCGDGVFLNDSLGGRVIFS